MKRRFFFILVIGFAAAMAFTAHAAVSPKSVGISARQTQMDAMRMPFVANMGQLPDNLAFRADTLVGNVYITAKGGVGLPAF